MSNSELKNTVTSAHTKPSTWVAVAIWGCSSLSAQPSLLSGAMHLAVLPLLLVLIIWLRGWEVSRD